MKKFIGLVIFSSVLFGGIGAFVEGSAAKFKSDDRALALLQKARAAIGGDVAINNVKSMSIAGKRTINFEIQGAPRSEQADIELNFELPGRIAKSVRVGKGMNGDKIVENNVSVFVTADGSGKTITMKSPEGAEIKGDAVKRVIVKKADGTEEVLTEDVEPVTMQRTGDKQMVFTTENNEDIVLRSSKGPLEKPIGGQQDEMLRTTLALLLSAPQGLDVSYKYAGEGDVDGNAVEIIDAVVGSSSIKLFLDKSSSLPRMISFKGYAPVVMMFGTGDANAPTKEDLKVFERRLQTPELTDIQIKYSDYRSVGGLLLPHKWTQSVGGKDEVTDISAYEINPANITEKFKSSGATVVVRKVEKP